MKQKGMNEGLFPYFLCKCVKIRLITYGKKRRIRNSEIFLL